MSTKVHLLSIPGGRRESGTLHHGSIYHDEVRDYDFADRALALRQRAGLTQRELGARLGVSRKAIEAWEGGYSYPGAERLKQLIALYLERGALAAGREEEEAAALWGEVREGAARRTVPFDAHWFASLRGARGTASAAPPLLAIVPPASAAPDDVPVALAAPRAARHDWGEAPDVPVVLGRAQELATLACWMCEERCRLVLVLDQEGNVAALPLCLQRDLPALPTMAPSAAGGGLSAGVSRAYPDVARSGGVGRCSVSAGRLDRASSAAPRRSQASNIFFIMVSFALS